MKVLPWLFLFLSACTVKVPEAPTSTSTSLSTSVATETAVVLAPAEPKYIEDTCPKPGEYQAVDISQAATPRFLEMMRYLKVGTIIRYGDYYPASNGMSETITGKVPRAAELKLIKESGLKLEIVFQHNNRWARNDGSLYNTFNATRGAQDAEKMHEQHPGLARWWYGVDFDPGSVEMVSVTKYAEAFKKVADKYGKKVGAYGSGYALRLLKEKGLIHYQWISMSTGFRESKTAVAAGNYDWLQFIDKVTVRGVRKDRICGGIQVDMDRFNPARAAL